MKLAFDRGVVQWLGLVLGPVLALICYFALPDSYLAGADSVELTPAARGAASIGVWMATWWLSEAVHVSITALVPLALFPLAGVMGMDATARSYGDDLIFLFMGGFVLSLSMQRWGLHRRIALATLRLVGSSTHRIVAGFMAVTAVLSMWVSNTATVVMMLPIGISVIDLAVGQLGEESIQEEGELPTGLGHNFALCLMLGIAYAASIGGVGTLIGTPPNLFVASYIEQNFDRSVSFAEWLLIGGPLVVVFLPICWLLLTRLLYPMELERIEGGEEMIAEAWRELGPMSRGEWATFVVFILAALSWVTRPLLVELSLFGVEPLAGLSDPGIAMIAAMVLFVVPVDLEARTFAMDWETARRLPWGILLLFGGGLALAEAVAATGVGDFLGAQVSALGGWPTIVVVTLVVALIIFLTELTSNTATTATLVPVLASVAVGYGMSPYALIVPAAIAASCAFMMPVATPPNAVVFGSGYVTIGQMVRAGIWLNLIGMALIVALTYAVILPWFGG